jgi:hypothetical protein
MMKRMATAVLYAAVSLLGPADAASAAFAIDSDGEDEAGVECMEFTPLPGRPDSSLVLSVASSLCGEQIDGAWVAKGRHAAASIHQTDDHVTLIDLAVEPAQYVQPVAQEIGGELLARALDRSREGAALKVIVETQGLEPAAVRSIALSRGYQFFRSHAHNGVERLEFYTDLYWANVPHDPIGRLARDDIA